MKKETENMASNPNVQANDRAVTTCENAAPAEEGCQYCRMTADDDVPDDREPVIEVTVGELSGLKLRILASIADDDLAVCLDVPGSDKDEHVKICYCPMCGRNLCAEKRRKPERAN